MERLFLRYNCVRISEKGHISKSYSIIPVAEPLDDTTIGAKKNGDIGYWPSGNSLVIFVGPMPMSKGGDPVPASSVNLVGAISGDASILKRAKGATGIRIERV